MKWTPRLLLMGSLYKQHSSAFLFCPPLSLVGTWRGPFFFRGALDCRSLRRTRALMHHSILTEGLLRGIEEVEEMFAHNIVQGKLNEQGNYGTHVLVYGQRWWALLFYPDGWAWCLACVLGLPRAAATHHHDANAKKNSEVKLRPEQHLQGKEHEEVAHVDDRLVNKTVVVEKTLGSKQKGGKEEEGGGGGCCGGGGSKH